MDFPGLDVKKMGDDELLRRINEIHGKMLYAHAYSSNPELLDQMQAILETLEFEQYERASKKAWEAQNRKAPKVIETDIDLVERKEVEQAKKTVRTGVQGSLLKRSKSPTSD
jgi:hypothetical protein